MTPNEVIDMLTDRLADPDLSPEKFAEYVDRIKALKQLQEG